MKVLFVINSSRFFCSHFLNLARFLKERGAEIHIACGDTKSDAYFKQIDFTPHNINISRSGLNFFSELNVLLSIAKTLAKDKFDIVHALTIKPVLYTGLINRFTKLISKSVLVTSITGMGTVSISKKLVAKFIWITIKCVYSVTFSSKNQYIVLENQDDYDNIKLWSTVDPERLYIVDGAGVDICKFHPSNIKNTKLTVSLVCRLLRDKGVLEYIEAGRILNDRGIEVDLQLIGSTDPENRTSLSSKCIRKAHENGYIVYMGQRSDVDKIYQMSHIACLPSYREGLPKSLIEACACGLPIITTNVPGCRQMITEPMNGLVVAPKSPEAIADAIQLIINDSKQLSMMGHNSRIFAEKKFSHTIINNAYFDIYLTGLNRENTRN